MIYRVFDALNGKYDYHIEENELFVLIEKLFYEDYFYDSFTDWLDEYYKPIDLPLLGQYNMSTLLSKLDPTLCYMIYTEDYLNFMLNDIKYETEGLKENEAFYGPNGLVIELMSGD